ncbi:YbdD/YjiX family protein [Paenibacillus sp. MZ04-78.2]|uniref:YbdD/YjiX family protein n=1 Tax=Paenibacillus sp. MZ04-78.2 TaxID=2962034 RepID=UPI0020B8B4D5|nr:YbdD/YjiX family protein [Paenibacillus sp. MZ04-78.2]MCP3776465.1 YbdD/YjiX family protein [Paenibacillus sp. MZ04-78.2]
MFEAVKDVLKYRRQFLDLLVGVPNYERYVEHRKECHPGEPIQTREAFFREAQEARYNAKGGKVSRCC